MTALAPQVNDQLDAGYGAIGTPTALELPDGLSFDEWQNIGRFVLQINNACQWWIGDWLFYGEFAYGQKYEAAVASTGLDESTLKTYNYVSGRVETLLRSNLLSWSHHRVVAALPRNEQAKWLNQAARNGWSVKDLVQHMNPTAELPVAPLPDITVSIVRIQVDEHRQAQWTAAAQAAGVDLTTWIANILDRESERLLLAA